MLSKKDIVLAQEFRESLAECEVKVLDSDLPKLISKFYEELKEELRISGKENNDEAEGEGEAFESVVFWAHDSFDYDNQKIDWSYGNVEKEDTTENLNLDYGKEYSNKTVLIRLLIPDLNRRKSIYDFWDKFFKLENNFKLSDVNEEFSKELVKSKKHEAEWCRFAGTQNKWYSGPEDLIYFLKSVVVNEEYIFICFDVDGLDVITSFDENFSKFEEQFSNIQEVLLQMRGVKKVWIKIRPETNTKTEYTGFHPAPDSDPFLVDTPLKNDHEWIT